MNPAARLEQVVAANWRAVKAFKEQQVVSGKSIIMANVAPISESVFVPETQTEPTRRRVIFTASSGKAGFVQMYATGLINPATDFNGGWIVPDFASTVPERSSYLVLLLPGQTYNLTYYCRSAKAGSLSVEAA